MQAVDVDRQHVSPKMLVLIPRRAVNRGGVKGVVGFDFVEQLRKTFRVPEIAAIVLKVWSGGYIAALLIPTDTDYLVTSREQNLRQVAPVLAIHTEHERTFHRVGSTSPNNRP
jgi:hypothetical protein